MPNRTKLFLALLTLFVAASIYVAARSTRALAVAMERLSQYERELSQATSTDAEAIEITFQRHRHQMAVLARQPEPRSEWLYPLDELETTLTRFANAPRNQQLLPQFVARANLYLAQLNSLRGNNRRAFDKASQSIAIATQWNDQETAGLSKNILACLFSATGDFGSALAATRESYQDLIGLDDAENTQIRAIVLRNIGLLERALGRDGTEPLKVAITILENAPESNGIGIAGELLIDSHMTLCEMYWAQGRIQEAARSCQQALQILEQRLVDVNETAGGKYVVARNRYTSAYRLAKQNQQALEELLGEVRGDDRSAKNLGQTASRWQWRPLYDSKTDLVSSDHWLAGTMPAEFEPQSALVLPWSKYQWAHQVVLEIATRVFDRIRLVVIADSPEAMEEARSSLAVSGVPLERISFGVLDYETPWFRDDGPIVSVSPSGDVIWFDSRLTRDQRTNRAVSDILPQVLSHNWRTRNADLALHLEGGMIHSNGQGLTICSNRIMTLNRDYGFSDKVIHSELRRVTGAKQLIFVDTLIGEETGHVDLFMSFTDPTTLVLGQYANRADPNAAQLDSIAAMLSKLQVGGEPLKIVRIPMPEGKPGRFPSYTNVIYANGALLVPSYPGVGRDLEPRVRAIYETLLPDWELEFIDCSRLHLYGGSLHCLASNLDDTEFAPMYPQQR